MKTTETQAKETLLEEPHAIKIGPHTYHAKPATLATIIEVGALCSRIPSDQLLPQEGDAQSVLAHLLHTAQHTAVAGDIIAALIVGAVPAEAHPTTRILNKWRRQRLKRAIAPHLTPSTTYKALEELIPLFEIDHFFALTAFLSQLNLIPATGEAETPPRGE